MKLKRYPSLVRAANALKKRGFSERFILENKVLKHQQSGRTYARPEIAIVEYHRFSPKNSLSSKVSIIFALETYDGIRGLLVAAYDNYGKVDLLEFMDRVKIKSREESVL